jgi:hypothetical protein
MKKLLPILFFAFLYTGVLAQSNPQLLTFPIELKYFKAEKTAQKIRLNWLAPCQVSEATFEIQHSADSRNFSTLFSLTADQARCAEPFEFTDPVVRSGKNFYRIRMSTASNLSLNSFTVAVVNNAEEFALNALLPSAVQSNAVLSISSGSAKQLTMVINSINGKQVEQKQFNVLPGTNEILLNLNSIQKGVYILSVYANGKERKTLQFVKQ